MPLDEDERDPHGQMNAEPVLGVEGAAPAGSMYVRPMHRVALLSRSVWLLVIWAAGMLCSAQDRGSLTAEFARMSAKERARIAAKETDEAAKDAAFQAVMARAEQAFREGRYDDALHGYEEARVMRPYNVYPKVKIEDLRVLIAKRAAAIDTVPPAREDLPPAPHPVEEPPVPAVLNPGQEQLPDPSGPEKPRIAAPVPEPVIDVPVPVQIHLPEPTKEPPAPRPSAEPAPRNTSPDVIPQPMPVADGMVERMYREGKAFVLERTITENGHSVVYKRVRHPYATFYFEDGQAVDERVWNARFYGVRMEEASPDDAR